MPENNEQPNPEQTEDQSPDQAAADQLAAEQQRTVDNAVVAGTVGEMYGPYEKPSDADLKTARDAVERAAANRPGPAAGSEDPNV